MTKLNTGFSNLTNDDLYHLGLTVSTKVNGIADCRAKAAARRRGGGRASAMELPPGAVREAYHAARTR